MTALPEPGSARPAPSLASRAVRLALALAILAAVAVAVGPGAVVETLSRADPWIVGLAVLLAQGQTLLAAWRWRAVAAALGWRMGIGRAFREVALAQLVNMTVPGGVAGDLLRAVRGRAVGASARAAVRSVVLDRLVGQAAFVVVAASGALLYALEAGALPGGALAALVLVPAAGLAAAGATAALARFGPRTVRAALVGLGADLAASLAGRTGVVQVVAGFALAAGWIGLFTLCASAVGAPLAPVAALGLVPLVLLAMLVPAGVGGWGLREGAAAVLLPLAGLAPAEAAAAAALYGVVVTLAGLPGLLAWRAGRVPPGESLSARTA